MNKIKLQDFSLSDIQNLLLEIGIYISDDILNYYHEELEENKINSINNEIIIIIIRISELISKIIDNALYKHETLLTSTMITNNVTSMIYDRIR